MKKERKLLTMSVVFVISLILVVLSYASLKREHHLQLESNLQQEQMIGLLQRDDIQDLISHIRGVLAGEIVYEVDLEPPSPLTGFSFHSRAERTYPDTHTIESGVTILEIYLNDDGITGELILTYYLHYLDSTGGVLRSLSVTDNVPEKWIIEQREGQWTVVRMLSYKEWSN